MESQKYTSPYAKLWEQKDWREVLKQEIKTNDPNAKITNKALIEQYFKRYMMLQPTDKANLIVNHPALLQVDKEKIDKVTNDTMMSLVNATSGCTVASLLFYKILLSKRRIFYDFYRKGRLSFVKKPISVFLLFMSWGAGLSYGYKQTIPFELFKQGMYKKYLIEYDKVYL
ncbi:unnamed protein product (macronuclear) [Paramecium tetraurelia]|uniref:Transmembrane protein n=1 Tax=Paramecium tetraurelia TaxID=5888 RepID=A0CSM6_PARTE|nr:uncharacterized protein GSPATT00010065001 [Paramecium tetraurelia]CAK73793.1 unnamed protein product [Paramecium tetraurelia]|eukprot:XP_001441190.1 hypothetical protein (macronuclear) [Paramecium tetraurelia strain d4-2]